MWSCRASYVFQLYPSKSCSGCGMTDAACLADQEVTRATLAGAITGAENGKQYWMDCQHYYKVAAMIVQNLDKDKQKLFTIGQ